MSIVDRVLLVLLCVCGVAVSVIGALTMLRVISLSGLTAFFQTMYDNPLYTALMIAAALLVTIICIKLLFSGTGSKAPQSALIKLTENGAVRIALSALDSMTQKHVRANERVRDVKSAIEMADDGVRIRLRLSLMPEANIPETGTQLQSTLKDYIESLSGIHVKEILIYVEDVANAPKTRVE
ncbi:MAG: alkaline shock response membrane anchor protein AmaP [Bacillota bacterium]